MFFDKFYLPTDVYIDWSFKAYKWILENFGGWREFNKCKLILPTRDFYPDTQKSGHDIAAFYFGLTKKHAGMSKWSCTLVAQEEETEEPLAYGEISSGVAGTFSTSWGGEEVTITYSQRQLKTPPSLIATFAHELSHYFLRSAPFDPPRGSFAEEPATDLCAIYLGFGIFQSNAALSFINQTGRTSKLGYLDEKQLSYAFAIFCVLKEIPPADVVKHLKTNPKAYFRAAHKDLAKRWGNRLDDLHRAKATRLWP